MLKFKGVLLCATSLVCLMSTWTTLSYAQNQNKESQVITANVFKKEQPVDNLVKFLNKNSIGIPNDLKELYKSAYSNMIAKSILQKEEIKETVAKEDTESTEVETATETSTENTAEVKNQTGVVTASALNVRAGAGTGYDKIDVVMRNEAITII